MWAYLKSSFFNHAFIWGLVVLHVYVIIVAPPSVSAATVSKAPVKCPFRLAHQFLAKPTALMASALATGNIPRRNSRRETQMLAYRRFPHLQSLVSPPLQRYAPNSACNVHYYDYSLSSVAGPDILEPHHAAMVDQAVDAEAPQPHSSSGKVKKTTPLVDSKLEVVVIGLSHHNAKVEVREKLAIPEANWNNASALLCEYPSIAEASVLSTCNRFEIYLAGENQYEVVRDAVDFLLKSAGGSMDEDTLRRNLFMLHGEDAIWHLFRVSAGLDSLVVGEGQILAQVKKAYEHGVEESGSSGKVVSRLLNVAVAAGKRVRSETGISKGAVSISSAAAEFSAMKLSHDCKIHTGMKDARIALIGAGKMARLLLVHLETHGVTSVTVVNRSKARVEELQREFPGILLEARAMDELWSVVADADVVYPCTASTTTIIDPQPLQAALRHRARPTDVQFVDISVPRNVHADCASVVGARCYNVDDLKLVVERNTAKRRKEMIEAEVILRDEMNKFSHWQHSLGAIPTITKLQEKAEAMRQQELTKAVKKLSSLTPKDLDTVDRMTKGIVAKLLHGPMSHLRQQAEGEATRAAIQQVQQAFQL